MNARLASQAALAVALSIMVAPIGASADSLQAAILTKLQSVNDKLGDKLLRRSAIHGHEIDYYIDHLKFEGLAEDDRRRVIEVAEDVAAGEWHLRSPIRTAVSPSTSMTSSGSGSSPLSTLSSSRCPATATR